MTTTTTAFVAVCFLIRRDRILTDDAPSRSSPTAGWTKRSSSRQVLKSGCEPEKVPVGFAFQEENL